MPGATPYPGTAYPGATQAYPGSGYPGGTDGTGGSSSAASALISALGTNTTETARQALEDVISAKLKCEVEDAALTQLALGSMAENMSGKHGETLFRVVTKPEQMRSGQSGITAVSLQQMAIQLLAAKEQPALRTKLAQQLGTVAASLRKPVVEMLLQPRADNLRAQIELYGRTDLDEASRRSLQGGFAYYGREVLNQLMSVSDPVASGSGFGGPGANAFQPGAGAAGAGAVPMPMPAGAPMPGVPGAAAPGAGYPGSSPGGTTGGSSQPASLTPEQANELVAGLWSPQFVAEVAKAVSGAKAADAAVLQLGAAMPLSPVRSSFQQLVDKHGKTGPDGLIDTQVVADVVRDPGLLLVLKSVQWKNRPKSAVPVFSGSGGPGVNPGGQPPRGNDARPKTGTSRKDASEQWLDATEMVVKSMITRFGAANRKGNAAAPPLKMPRGDITAEYYLKWPDDLPDSAKQLGVAPLTVHYVRLETNDRNAPTALMAQVRNKHTHAIQGGFWYENRLSQKGVLSSLDVMITQGGVGGGSGFGAGGAGASGFGGGGGGAARPKTQAQLVVDILYVEAEDYAK
jgi:hypothetical protein